MKKSCMVAVAASVLSAPVMAANLENPMFMPTSGTFYSKLSNGLMVKKADHSSAHVDRGHDGNWEFPIIRIQEELGYGITDNWDVHGSVQYTHDDDIGRTGLSGGRIGTTYRVINNLQGFSWDLYGDAHLGGVGKMRGTYRVLDLSMTPPINAKGVLEYDNYSNGQWGYHFGTRFGQTWDKLTASVYGEVLRTIGDDNNELRIAGASPAITAALAGTPLSLPSEISAELRSTTDYNAGLNLFYQMNEKYSFGTWFRYSHHDDQGIKKITTELSGAGAMVAAVLEKKLANMNDGFDEYAIGFSWANQVSLHTQVVLYAEYTMDDANSRSQNGTDFKGEAGVRLNFAF